MRLYKEGRLTEGGRGARRAGGRPDPPPRPPPPGTQPPLSTLRCPHRRPASPWGPPALPDPGPWSAASSREILGLVVDTSLTGLRVARELDRIAELRSYPCMIVSDNGTELTSNAILA